MTEHSCVIDSVVTEPDTASVEVCGVVVDPSGIPSLALRKIVSEMASQDEVTLASCRHKDWRQQAQCGCVMGCIGG